MRRVKSVRANRESTSPGKFHAPSSDFNNGEHRGGTTRWTRESSRTSCGRRSTPRNRNRRRRNLTRCGADNTGYRVLGAGGSRATDRPIGRREARYASRGQGRFLRGHSVASRRISRWRRDRAPRGGIPAFLSSTAELASVVLPDGRNPPTRSNGGFYRRGRSETQRR